MRKHVGGSEHSVCIDGKFVEMNEIIIFFSFTVNLDKLQYMCKIR